MNKNSKIYIAGHRGLVGSAIVRTLQKRGYDSLILKTHGELDLTRQKETEEFFESEKPEYVFLAAAKVGGILANSTYKADFIYINSAIALNLIHSAYRAGVKKLFNLGSSCIYPKYAPQPMKEEFLLTGQLEPTNEPYAIAKILAIKLCRYYNEQYGTNFISGMPTNIYGPNDNFNLETAHALPALIRKFYLAKLLEEKNLDAVIEDLSHYPVGFGLDKKIRSVNPPQRAGVIDFLKQLGVTAEYVTLWGTGKPYREFLYVDDLADACVYLMENCDYQDIGEFVNIGTGIDMTIAEIAKKVKSIVGFEGEIRYDTSKPDGTPRKQLDISKISSLGWKPSTSLEEGIWKTFEWYKNQLINITR